MSAFADLVLQNNAAANVTFSPNGIDSNSVATYLTSDAVFDAKSKVTMSVALPKAGSSVARIKQKIVIPIMSTVDTTLKLADLIVNIDAVVPKVATETNRLDARKYAEKLLGHAVSTDAFQKLQGIY